MSLCFKTTRVVRVSEEFLLTDLCSQSIVVIRLCVRLVFLPVTYSCKLLNSSKAVILAQDDQHGVDNLALRCIHMGAYMSDDNKGVLDLVHRGYLS